MKRQIKIYKLSQDPGLIAAMALGVFLVAGVAYSAWQEPTQAPPGGNVPAPLHQGSAAQTKAGNLTVSGNMTANTFTLDGDTISEWPTGGNGGGGLWSSTNGDIYFDTGNVGIGTDSPDRRLHVNQDAVIGPGNNRGNINILTNINALPAEEENFIFTTGGGGSGFFDNWQSLGFAARHANTPSSQIAFFTSTEERMRISGDGNVGIGTDSPDYDLEVVRTGGNAAIVARRDGTTGVGMLGGGTSGGFLSLRDADNNVQSIIRGYGVSGVQGYFLAGNIGIGTDSPGGRLHLGSGAVGTNIIRFGSPSGSAGPHGLDFLESSDGSVGMSLYYRTAPQAIFIEDGAGNQRVKFEQGGNVGIGTDSPGSKLQINNLGTIDEGSDWASFGSNLFYNGSWNRLDDTKAGMAVIMQGGAGGTQVRFRHEDASGSQTQLFNLGLDGSDLLSPFSIEVGGHSAETPTLYISRNNDGAGASLIDVEIGSNTTNRYYFRGIGSGGTTRFYVSTNGAIYSLGGDSYFGGNVSIGTDPSGTYRFTIQNTTTNNQGYGIARGWHTYSDARVKSDYTDVTYGLEELLQLQPRQFIHHGSEFVDGQLVIEENGETTIGFLAQEVYNIIPQAARRPANESTELWGLADDKLIPVIVKSIQELSDKIDEYLEPQYPGGLVDVVQQLTFRQGQVDCQAEAETCRDLERKFNQLMSMTGRVVPVRVSLAGGEIKPGDPIAPSDITGVGKKAATGLVVGEALEAFTAESPQDEVGVGTIAVVIGLSYQSQSADLTQLSQLIKGGEVHSGRQLVTFDQDTGNMVLAAGLDLSGRALVNVKSLASANGSWSLSADGQLTVEDLTVRGQAEFGTASRPAGLTLFDRQTGEPFCLSIIDGQTDVLPGRCPQVTY